MHFMSEVIAYITILYLVVIPALLYFLSRSTTFKEEGGQYRGKWTGSEGENDEYRKAA